MKLRRLLLTAWLLSLTLSANALAGGSPAEDVSVDSWVYDAVFELSAQGYFSGMLLHTRPWSRGELAAAIAAELQQQRTLPAGNAILFDRLKSEFAEELAQQSPAQAGNRQYVRLGGGPTARTDQIRHGVARNRAGADPGRQGGYENSARLPVRAEAASEKQGFTRQNSG